MQGQHARPGVLATKRNFNRVAQLLAPAAAHFHGGGNRDRAGHIADDLLHERQVLQTTRSAIPAHDLLHRTAKIDVQKIRPVHVFDQRRGFRHGPRVGPKNLNANGALRLMEAKVVPGPLTAATEAFGADELADHDIGAIRPAQPAERRLAHASLRREVERDRSVLQSIQQIFKHDKKLTLES